MNNSVKYSKWKEENPNYSKEWYQANKEKIREAAKKKYQEKGY